MTSRARSRLIRSHRSRRRRRGRTVPGHAAPTRETLTRLRPDPLWTLLQRGRLTQEQVDAAHDIRHAFEEITAPVRMRAMRTLSTTDGAIYDMIGGRKPAAPAGPLSESERSVLLQQRFQRWAAAMQHEAVPLGPVIDIVVEGKACRTVDAERGRRNGWATDVLVRALEVYLASKRPPQRPIDPVSRRSSGASS